MIRKSLAIAGTVGILVTGCADNKSEEVPHPVSLTVPTDQGYEATIPNGTMDRCEFDDGTGAPCVYVADEQGADPETGEFAGTSFVMLEEYGGPVALVTHEQARALLK